MIRALWLSVWLGFSFIGFLNSQTQINAITKLGNEFCIFTESDWFEDTLFVVGTSGFFSSGIKAPIVKYSADGSLISTTYLLDTSNQFNYGFWNNGLVLEEGAITHTATKSIHNPEQVDAVILQLDANGNILRSNTFKNYYHPLQNTIVFRDFQKLSSGFIITALSWKNDQDAQSCLLRLDDSLNQVWHKCYGNSSREIPNQVFSLSNGHFIVLSNSTDLGVGELYQGSGNAYHRGYIFETDANGILQWEWRSPDKSESTSAAYLENDSILIVASGMGTEYCSQPGNPNSSCRFFWTGGVYKFNLKTREKIWETRLSGGPSATMFDNSHLDIIPSVDKDGYIVCGAGYYLIPDCRIDTIDKCWALPGIIAKVSNDGDSLWLRKYFGITDIFESNRLHDVEITPNLGYSFVGEAFNGWPGETQGSHGWLLMTDKFGCLVPGCHLISNTEDLLVDDINIQSSFLVHPNPVVDVITIFITGEAKNQPTLKLLDGMGHELDSWSNFEQGGTYMIPANHLPAGNYILSMVEKNRITGSKMIIKL